MIVAAGLLLPQFALGQSHELKVMSYNIRLSTGNDGTNAWMYRCPATLEMLKDQQPDVFGVQEALEDQILCGCRSRRWKKERRAYVHLLEQEDR